VTVQGCFFFTYYQLNEPSPSDRPITFAFNGGPGSASLWLHLGALGPKRVMMGSDGVNPPLPFQLENNDDSPLDLTDIVMIDPIGTGYSKAAAGTSADQFFGAKNDATSVATFIRDFRNQYDRLASPLYVMGESYGGIRGSLVTQYLQSTFYIPVKGLILVSPYLSSTTNNFNEDDNDVPYITYFPSYATTAWYQHTLSPELQAMDVDPLYNLAKGFAAGEYRDALSRGNELSAADALTIATQMSYFTGIPVSQIQQWNLRIQDVQFFSGLLYAQRKMVGRFDSRFVRSRLFTQDGATATDPSDSATGYPFVPAVNSYIRNDLGFNLPTPYVDSANIDDWSFGSDAQEFGVMTNLSQAMLDNPSLKVFVANGYFDLACPMGTAEYERDRLDPSVDPTRMEMHRYPSGHMVYINPVALHQLKLDLTQYFSGK
jgi:carboxypeptidase C (cathepsin A)